MRMLPVGADAVLVEVDGLAEAMAVHARLVAAPPRGIVDLVPAATTVLVRFDRAAVSRDRLRAWIAEALAAAVPPPARVAPVSVPVAYDGEDLADTAALVGSSPDALAARHAATTWTVAFTGFAPGFGYLVSPDWDLDVPRLASPRTRVPAGSVGLAGAFTGAYPRDTPGGWRLIGATTAPLFDPDAAQPALLVPGAEVRFEPTRPVASVPALRPPRAPSAPSAAAPAPSRAGMRVVAPGAFASVQDGGRPGRAAEGIAGSGAADRAAWQLGNRLVGNAPGVAAIEVLLGGFRAVAETDLTVVVTGAWAPVLVDGRALDPFVAHAWPAGTELALGPFVGGARAYLAVRGGWDAAVSAGSRSTDTLSGLGPAPLRAGDRVAVGARPRAEVPALPLYPWSAPPAGTDAAPLEVPFTPGPRADWFTGAAVTALAETVWTVSTDADRVGVRLDGPELERARAGELASEGMVPGAIQVPPSGRPVVFGVDGPVTGGYPVIGVVTEPGLARLAQARPGDRVRLRRVPGV